MDDRLLGIWMIDYCIWMIDYCRWMIDYCRWMIDYCRWMIDFCWWMIDYCRWMIDYCRWMIDYCIWMIDYCRWMIDIHVLFDGTKRQVDTIIKMGQSLRAPCIWADVQLWEYIRSLWRPTLYFLLLRGEWWRLRGVNIWQIWPPYRQWHNSSFRQTDMGPVS
jgi:hypothetical protein